MVNVRRPSPDKIQILETVRRTSWVWAISIFYGLDQPTDGSIGWINLDSSQCWARFVVEISQTADGDGKMGPNAAL